MLTDSRVLLRLDGVDAVQWLDVTGTARKAPGGSWVNEAEAERVRISVERLLLRLPPKATVGVVTPFRAQRELLGRAWENEPRVRVGTVHTFQGGQQDVMLLSLVAGATTRSSTLSWLCREVNLWNVAITRARAHLIVFRDLDFWSGRTGMPFALTQAARSGAALGTGSADLQDEPELLLGDRFQKLIADAASDVQVDRNVMLDGYICDFDVRFNGARSAVLLDRGAPAGADPARHLRVALARVARLPNGVRVPAWHAWAGRTDRIFGVGGSQRPG